MRLIDTNKCTFYTQDGLIIISNKSVSPYSWWRLEAENLFFDSMMMLPSTRVEMRQMCGKHVSSDARCIRKIGLWKFCFVDVEHEFFLLKASIFICFHCGGASFTKWYWDQHLSNSYQIWYTVYTVTIYCIYHVSIYIYIYIYITEKGKSNIQCSRKHTKQNFTFSP